MIRSPDAIADQHTGDLVPVVHAEHPARLIGHVWLEDFNNWPIDVMVARVEGYLRREQLSARVITRRYTEARRPLVECK